MCSNAPHVRNAALANLLRPMPLDRKLHLLGRNLRIKIVTHSACCGHPGEPGC